MLNWEREYPEKSVTDCSKKAGVYVCILYIHTPVTQNYIRHKCPPLQTHQPKVFEHFVFIWSHANDRPSSISSQLLWVEMFINVRVSTVLIRFVLSFHTKQFRYRLWLVGHHMCLISLGSVSALSLSDRATNPVGIINGMEIVPVGLYVKPGRDNKYDTM